MDPSLYVSSIDHHHHPQFDGKVPPNPYIQQPCLPSASTYFLQPSSLLPNDKHGDCCAKRTGRFKQRGNFENSRIVDVKKTYKFAASPDACVSASQPQKHAGRRGGASNLDNMRPPGRPTKNKAATMVPALVLAGSSSTVCQQRVEPSKIAGLRKVKEDTVISLSSDSSASDDDESGVSFTLNHKKKGSLVEDEQAMVTNTSCSVKRRKLVPKIKNPEKYLENPENIYFESELKNRPYELLIDAKVVKTHCLKFKECIHYIDSVGKVQSETMKTKDRVCIRYWNRICDRNKLKKEDRVLCELLREGNTVYAINVHVVRAKDL
ncbi:unnamed protein product [Brassica oleracea var. botrytis]